MIYNLSRIKKLLVVLIVFVLYAIPYSILAYTCDTTSSKTVTRGSPVTINWKITGAVSCTPRFDKDGGVDYPVGGGMSDPHDLNYKWLNLSPPSGDSNYSFGGGHANATPGTYTFTCRDASSGKMGCANLTVTACGGGTPVWDPATLKCVADLAPTVSAGSDRAITLPISSVTGHAGTASGGNAPLTTTWSLVSKPSGATDPTISAPSNLTTNFTNMNTAGTYVFRLTVKDLDGDTVSDNMSIIVSPAAVPAANFTTNTFVPATINEGSSSKLTWVATNATSVGIDCGSGPAAAQTAWEASGLSVNSNKTVVSTHAMIGTTNCTATAYGAGGNDTYSFTWRVYELPELTVIGSITPAATKTGSSTNFSGTVQNTSGTSTGIGFYNFMQVYPAADGAGSPVGLPRYGSGVRGPGTTVKVTSAHTFAAPGTYSIRLCADKENSGDLGDVAEGNEGNNCGGLTNIVVTDAAPTDCSAIIIDHCELSTTPSGGKDGTCESGYTGSCEYSCNSTAWSKNSNSCALPSSSDVDLVVSVDPTDPGAKVGTLTTFSATIKNNGSDSTGSGFNNFIQIADDPNGGGTITDLPFQAMGALNAGQTDTTSQTHTFPSTGLWSVRACADKKDKNDSGDIDEGSNEDNNCGNWVNFEVTDSNYIKVFDATDITSNSVKLSGEATAAIGMNQSILFRWGTTNPGSSCGALTFGGVMDYPVGGIGNDGVTRPFGLTILPNSNATDYYNGQTASATGGTPPYTYEWSVYSKPYDAPDPVISNPTSATTNFTNLTKIGDYTFKVKVTDSLLRSNSSSVTITVSPDNDAALWPIADAGPNRQISHISGQYEVVGQTASVFGGTPPYTYNWRITDAPGGSNPQISAPNSATTDFTNLTVGGTYVFDVTVSDSLGRGDVSVGKTISVYAPVEVPPYPIAYAGGDRKIVGNILKPDTTYYFCAERNIWSRAFSNILSFRTLPNTNPLVDSYIIENDYYTPAYAKFSCLDTTSYEVRRAPLGANVLIASGAYSGEVRALLPTIEDDYQVICKNGAASDSEVRHYHYPPPATIPFIDSYPKTIKTGDTSTINWNISFPVASCALTAAAVCANDICSPEQTAAAAALNAIITTQNTDVDDPNTSRPITSAVKTIAPGHESTDHKALGKKTFSIANSTDFTVRCGATTATTRVRVANSSEQ